MQGNHKVEIKVVANEHEYNFFFPFQANSEELLGVLDYLKENFTKVIEDKKLADLSKGEEKEVCLTEEE
jgi:hypothetical protein